MDSKAEKLPQLSVHLIVRHCESIIAFYTQAFEFKLVNSEVIPGENGGIQFAMLRYEDAVIMISSEGAFGDTQHKAPITLGTPPSSNCYVHVKNVDSFYQNAISAGAKSILEPQDSFWGDRICRLSDPEGYEWMFATTLIK